MTYLLAFPASAQYYQDNYPRAQYGNQPGPWNTSQEGWNQGSRAGSPQPTYDNPPPHLQYDDREAEMILRDQVNRTQTPHAVQDQGRVNPNLYDDFALPSTNSPGHVGHVMAEAQRISQILTKRNGKSFIVIDKRNFQFYLYDRAGKLLRIGPVAIGKGHTNVGAFETPVGIFPIRQKLPVDDWIRPDWYFVEEGEPIPQRWEDRRVPGFFRYKLVFDGTRYIHYAEATGGRLTHGCLGLDWQDAEAVFHTLHVGSYCIIMDRSFLARLAKGEFPVRTASKPSSTTPEDKPPSEASGKSEATVVSQSDSSQERVFRSLW
ncbi:MAG: L,D-transpeptidase [Pseudomonadota bacterium]